MWIFFSCLYARPYVTKLTEQTIEQGGWEVLQHPSWSSDLAPSDYHLFLSLRNHLCDKHYEDFNELNSDLSTLFESKSTSFYRCGIKILPARWAQVVENDDDYIAGWYSMFLLKNKFAYCGNRKNVQNSCVDLIDWKFKYFTHHVLYCT